MYLFTAIAHTSSRLVGALDATRIADFLPARPAERAAWTSRDGRLELHGFRIGTGTNRSLVESDERRALTVDGFMLSKERPGQLQPLDDLSIDDLFDSSSSLAQSLYGEFTLVAMDESSGVFVTSNLGGSHSLYYARTSDYIAISNRAACLLSLPGVSDTLDEVGFAWKALQGYISGQGTAFADIAKLGNGSVGRVTRDGSFTIHKPSLDSVRPGDLAETIRSDPLTAYSEQFQLLEDYLKGIRASTDVPIEIPLSGGKDSRLILGHVANAGLMDGIDRIWTRGPAYSPEVLAAADVCSLFGYERHEVVRPPHFSFATITPTMIVKTISNTDGLLSLFDFAGIGKNNNIKIQGHQNALRPGRFSRSRVDSINNFLEDSIKSFSDVLKILRKFEFLTNEVRRFFFDLYENGALVENLGDLHYIFDRNPNWVAVMSSTDYCSGLTVNPLMIGEIFKFSLSSPLEHRKSELFHFLSMAWTNPALTEIPFADQAWSDDLPSVLQQIGWPDQPKIATPYKTRKHFPNLGNRWISNVKLDLLHHLHIVLHDLLLKHQSSIDQVIDFEEFIRITKEKKTPNFLELYRILGIYGAVIILEYGVSIFDLRAQPDVIADFGERMKHARNRSDDDGVLTDSPETREKAYQDSLSRHEASLAAFMRELHARPA